MMNRIHIFNFNNILLVLFNDCCEFFFFTSVRKGENAAGTILIEKKYTVY